MVLIREVQESEYDQWAPLWYGHSGFFNKPMTEKLAQHSFKKLANTSHPFRCFVAIDEEGEFIGLVTFCHIDHLLTMNGQIYLSDLFVSPTKRSKGIGRKLIERVSEVAKENDIPSVFWFCHYTNHAALILYQKMAETKVYVYRRTIE